MQKLAGNYYELCTDRLVANYLAVDARVLGSKSSMSIYKKVAFARLIMNKLSYLYSLKIYSVEKLN